jgi:hypothetical protein
MQSCSGQLPGDLSAQALAAQHETDQVTIQSLLEQVELAAKLQPDASLERTREVLSSWEGGLPTDVSDAGTPLDSGAADR